MKKEKKVRQYTRKTKSGKTVIVKAHTAKYDAADKAKEIAKKKGAGEELEERKKKKPIQLEIPFDKEEEKKVLDEVKDTEKKASKKVRPVGSGTNGPTPKEKSEKKATKTSDSKSTSEPAFTAAEFKEWYRGTGSAADKKVAKALRAQLGRSGYRKLEDEAIDNYSSRGHLSMFKRVSGGSEVSAKTGKSTNKANGESKKSVAKEKAAETKTSKAKTKDNKSIKVPKNESQEQREARWNRGEFTNDEKATAIMVYDMSGSKNNLHPKLSAWAKKEIKRMDDERAAKVDTKILKGLNRDVVSKLATLQGKKKLSKEDEAFIDKHVAPSGLIRGTKVSAFDAISAHKKEAKTPKSRSGVTELSMVKDKTLRDKIIKHVQAVTDGEYSAKNYTWKDALAAARHPSEKSLRSSLQKKFGLSVKGVKSKPYEYYNEG